MKPITHRVVFPVQAPGDIGKTTFLDALISWLNYARIDFDGFDCDLLHRSLSSRNPSQVNVFDGVSSDDAFHRLMLQLDPDAPLTLIDFPGQKTEFLLGDPSKGTPGAFLKFQVFRQWAEHGIRATVILFASNEKKAVESAIFARRRLQDSVDYLLVRNPAKFSSDVFEQTGLFGVLKDQGVPVIDLPRIGDEARERWSGVRGVGRETKGIVTLDEAVGHEKLDEWSQMDIGHFRDAAWSQLENAAVPLLVPNDKLILQRVQRPLMEKPVAVNVFEDPLS